MLRSVLARLVGRLPGSSGVGGEDDDDESGFRPSRLDASVLYAHGADVDALESEIADMEEQAREIESARRDG